MTLTVWQLDPAQLTPYYNLALCEALAQADCHVRYFTTKFLYADDLPKAQHFQMEEIYFKGLHHQRLLKTPRVRRILRAISYPFGHLRILREADCLRPDIVHIQWSRLPTIDLWLIQRLQKMGIPIVHTIHDVVPLFAMNAKNDGLKQIYLIADRLIVHAQANFEDLLKVYPEIQPEKVAKIPLIESATHRQPSTETQKSARHHLNLPLDAPIFLFQGSIRYYKGLDILVDAFEHVLETHPEAQLVIAGKADPLEADKLPDMEKLRAHPNIHLFEGFIPDEELWRYFVAADVAVYPYRHIYQSAALITGMGYGLPVIASAVGAMPETIDENGWIVPAENPQAFADAMREALENRAGLIEMGKRSRWIIDERHNPQVVAEKLKLIYQELL